MTTTATDLVSLTIDGIDVQVPKGTLLVEAAKSIHRDIPVYCYHEKLGPAGLCRVCLVEIEGMPKLQIACNTVVTDGMKVNTANGKVNDGRRAILEFFLLNHPLDCPICDKGGECDLQDYAVAYGQRASRLVDAKSEKPKAVDLGPTIVLDEERCIVCQRCVRFDDIITQERSLTTIDRGAHTIIATASGSAYVSDFSGNVTELCPVGALTSKTYRFKSRPWDNHRTTTTCTQCSVGCQMHVDARLNLVTRTMNVEEDAAISDGWLCDRGRYNLGYLGDERRLTQPMYRSEGRWSQIGWDDAIALWASALQDAIAARGPKSAGAIGGGRLLNEEAFLLQHIHRALGVENLDWRAGRQQRAYPGPDGGTPADLERAQVIITVGCTPEQLAPVLDLRIRKAVARNGATLISLGDHPASSVLGTIVQVATVDKLRAAIPAAAERIAIVGDGATLTDFDAMGALCNELRANGKTLFAFALGEQANARGAEAMGMLPGPQGLDTTAMLTAAGAGEVDVLALFGVNPMLRHPDRALVEAALETTPFVVVSDLFMTETAERATLVLPVCSAFEKSGTTLNLSGDVLPVHAAVPGPDGVIADGDILVALAEALGIAIPGPDELDATVRARAALPPANAPHLATTSVEPVAAGAYRLVIAQTIFSGGGTLAHDERVAVLRTTPRATVHPQTAGVAGIRAGDVIDLIAESGAKLHDLVVVSSDRAPRETITIVDALPAAPANTLGLVASVRITNVRSGARELSGAAGE
jgi:NADH-quinone oxidoreductase subunit G